ncbi:BLOC-1 subunit 2 family protein [Anoxybacteroides amylolyticum]|uniref:Laminin Domain II family protein n=1 Tax=Anoxybacteroides amylolyticum TaxID=294699 RepID=A0A167SW54_9BACL|nr:BLOC-1 subunit 2 family protein [Anoxybacillus amylolyticus]ANB59176.1 laminin Domain II family protein [Anoxybacillus amylolyticus]
MVEQLLYEILHEVKATREKVESLEKRVEAVEQKVETLEKEVSSLRQQVQALDGKVQALDGKVQALDGKVQALDRKVQALDEKVQTLDEKVQALDEKVQLLDERTLETKAICEAVRHGQEVLAAKYDALALDVHKMQGNITHLTNILEEKVLPALTDHESSIQVLNNRVFKVESTLQKLVHL